MWGPEGDSWQFSTQARSFDLSWHTTSKAHQWPRQAAVTKNKGAEKPRIASAWEEGVNYCCDKPWLLHMQLDHDVAGARKLVPAVWPWSMLLRTGDRVQVCGLIIYSYNTATLETSDTHCIYLHSYVVALMLGLVLQCVCVCVHAFVCDSEKYAGFSAHHLVHSGCRGRMLAQWISHSTTPNYEQCDRLKIPHSSAPDASLNPISHHNAVYWYAKKVVVTLLPSLAFVETIWPRFWFQLHSWNLSPSFLGTTYSGKNPPYSISDNYISLRLWFRKVWFCKSSQWEIRPTNKVYGHEKQTVGETLRCQ